MFFTKELIFYNFLKIELFLYANILMNQNH